MPLIPENIVSQVIERSDIVDIVSLYLPLKKAGRNFKALSPFKTEKTPSFVVSPDKQIFHCFSTGTGGNVVTFVMKMERLDFPEALRFLAQKAGIDIPEADRGTQAREDNRRDIYRVNGLAVDFFEANLLSDKSQAAQAARAYLKKREITPEAAKDFRLGFAPESWDGLISHLREKNVSLGLMETAGLIIPREKKEGYYDRFRNRIIFPIFDTRGNCRAFGARAMDDSPAKYINSPETPCYTKGQHLYAFGLSKDEIAKNDYAIIVEGYIDCLMPYQAGVRNIVASLGTALTIDQIRLLRRYTKHVVLMYDTDQAGESAMMRSLDTLIEEGMEVKVVTLAEGEDPDSFIRKFGQQAFYECVKQARPLIDYKLSILVNKHDAKTVEGKAKICEEILPTINKFGSEIKKTGYLRQIAQSLGVPEKALEVELKKIQQGSPNAFGEDKPPAKLAAAQPLRQVEQQILKLLLEEGSFIPLTMADVELSDFRDEKVRTIISRIFENFQQHNEVNISTLMAELRDQNLQQILSRILAEDELIGDKERIYKDYIRRMKQDRLKLIREQLREEIREAEITGNLNKLEDLKERFNQLIKG